MKLYLVQHGDAVFKEQNPERPLSDKGRRDVERMASFLARARVKAGRVVHSGKRRAMETAVILARVLGPGALTEQADGINPDDVTDTIAAAAAQWRTQGAADVMVVTHMPFAAKALARLAGTSESAFAAAFKPGTVACLESTPEGGWTLAWMVRPELLGS